MICITIAMLRSPLRSWGQSQAAILKFGRCFLFWMDLFKGPQLSRLHNSAHENVFAKQVGTDALFGWYPPCSGIVENMHWSIQVACLMFSIVMGYLRESRLRLEVDCDQVKAARRSRTCVSSFLRGQGCASREVHVALGNYLEDSYKSQFLT